MTMKALKSADFWVGIASIAAIAGIACVVAGLVSANRSLTNVGLWLVGPLVVGGVFFVLVVIPLLIRANRRKPPTEPPKSPPL